MAKDTKAPEPTPLWCSTRLTLSFVSFLGFVNLYAQRVNLSVGMVCMVNHTYVASLYSDQKGGLGNNSVIISNISDANAKVAVGGDDRCGGVADIGNGTASPPDDGEFLWSKETQGLILGSFFWGYLITQVPGGWLSARYGGKRVFGYAVVVGSLLTLIMPVAARTHWAFLLVLRILTGICQGVVWPAMAMLWTMWAPPLETGKLTGFCYAGSQIGNVLTFPIAALLCNYGFDGGWPSIFYIIGSAGVIWFFAWTFLVFDSPAVHPRISEEEKSYIESSLRGRSAGKSKDNLVVPWVKILTSTRVWAIVVTHMCANWGTYTFLTNIPTYMKEVLKFDIKKNGLLSALPYIGFWLIINVSGHLFDLFLAKGWMNITVARKIGNSMGLMLPGLFIIGVGFMDCTSAVGAVILLTIGVAMSGCQYGSGFVINPGDIAPRFAGIIFGFSNTFATIPGFLAPIAIGIITSEQTQAQWQQVFFISAAIYTFGTIFYIIFGSGEIQHWAVQDTTMDIAPPLLESKDDHMLESRSARSAESEKLKSAETDVV